MSAATPDRVAQIGRDIAQVWKQIWKHDYGPTRSDRDWWRQEFILSDRLGALEAMAAEIRASTLEDAMVQIMLAHAAADCMPGDEERSATTTMRTVSRLLYNALATLEELSGTKREDLGGEAYMRRDLDPHEIVLGRA